MDIELLKFLSLSVGPVIVIGIGYLIIKISKSKNKDKSETYLDDKYIKGKK